MKVGQALRKKHINLNINFHNPNSNEDTVKMLIPIAAEIAMNKISETILHIDNLKVKNDTLREP